MLSREQFYQIKHHWRNDLISGFSVSLVALPLGLVISLASGAPPMAGVYTAIVGGLVTTFIRGSHVAINGPGNSMIIVCLASITLLNDVQDGQVVALSGFKHTLGVFTMSGICMILLGLLRVGKFTDMLPSSVVKGILAGIGVMIMAKQLYVALGIQEIPQGGVLSLLYHLPEKAINFHPVITMMSLVVLAVLVMAPRIPSKFIHFMPPVLLVVVVALVFSYVLSIDVSHDIIVFGTKSHLDPNFLVHIPDDLFGSVFIPSFGKLGSYDFWLMVFSVVIIGSVEGAVSAKAIEKLDPFKRRVNVDKDLVGMGVSTIIASFVGGLPVLTVIARSSVNVNNGAKTKWSNFFQGVFLLLIVWLFTPIINHIPIAALAVILVYTGYKLTSPLVIREIKRRGPEQLVIFVFTYASTLVFGIIWGLIVGVAITFLIHAYLSQLDVYNFFGWIRKMSVTPIEEKGEGLFLKVRGVVNFLSMLKVIKYLEGLPQNKEVTLGFSQAKLVDHTVLEYIHDFGELYKQKGGDFHIVGLGAFQCASTHPWSLHIKQPFYGKSKKKKQRITKRQQDLGFLIVNEGWVFEPGMDWNFDHFNSFPFFESRSIEYRRNVLKGNFSGHYPFEICDVAFDEGVYLAREEYHTTILYIKLDFKIPPFILEKEVLFDKIMEMAGYQEINYQLFTEYSGKFVIKGITEASLEVFLTKELIAFLENESIYHLESNGEALVVFKHLRLATPKEILDMVYFSEKLLEIIKY